nr:isochorismatase family protein [Streptomyces candidus]
MAVTLARCVRKGSWASPAHCPNWRWRKGSPARGVLRNLGCRSVAAAGAAVHAAVPNAVFDLVNTGFAVVVARDAVAGVPREYAQAVMRYSPALVAEEVSAEDVMACW